MTDTHNDEMVKNEIDSILQKYEGVLNGVDLEIENIENEGKELFERKVIAIKNALVENVDVQEEDMHKVFVEELGKARQQVLENVEKRIKELLEKNGVREG